MQRSRVVVRAQKLAESISQQKLPSFLELGLRPELVQALEEQQLHSPTEIQVSNVFFP
jgi:superfamily II DNA/RNA helicase